MSIPPHVRHISECFIRPKSEGSNPSYSRPVYLTAWDVSMMSHSYMQKGLLFANPPTSQHDDDEEEEDEEEDDEAAGRFIRKETFLEKLKSSLSLALVHFYPLVGRLVTQVDEDRHSCFVFIDCQKGPGVKFAHAALDVTVDDVLSPADDVPRFVGSLFDKEARINNDGHSGPLLSIQVTDLVDGVFLACSMNHAVADGTSFWHFINMWSEIFKTKGDMSTATVPISRPPVHERWFPDGYSPIVRLPYTRPDQFIVDYESPRLRTKFFHFSSESLAKLKARANADCRSNNISTFQAMAALVWISITRARSLPHDQQTFCRVLCDNRKRLNPPLSQGYFGNSIQAPTTFTTTGDLLKKHGLESAALLLKQVVENNTDESIRDWLSAYRRSPFFYQITPLSAAGTVTLSGSPRFNMYGNEFGLGKPLAIRSGHACKRDGMAICHPGSERGGSIDLEIYLEPESMTALESDEEFMSVVS